MWETTTTTRPPAGFALIKPGQTYFGKQGITYSVGASAETVGAQVQTICMNVMPVRLVRWRAA